MSKKVYIVFPPTGYGGNDMVIVADNENEASEMFYTEAGMNGDYYDEARKQGCKAVQIFPDSKGVKYVREDNL